MDKLPKVELHVHFDGSCEVESLKEFCRADDLDKERFPYDDDEAFRKVVSVSEPQENLEDFLKTFPEVCYIISTKQNLMKCGIDFCRRQSANNIVYTEVRYCPNLFTVRGLTPEEGLVSILEGLKEGESQYGIKVRSILCFMRSHPEWSMGITELAIKYKDSGVLAVDIAGNELKPMTQEHINAFQKASEDGLSVTAHAAESGVAGNVKEAIIKLNATRIGHGYRVLEDPDVYQLAKIRNVHFETCLTSSIYTSSGDYENHAIKVFAKENVNFGLNTDNPGITAGVSLNKEFVDAETKLGLTREQRIECIYNAAKSTFLPPDESKDLIQKITEQIEQCSNSS